MLPRGGHFHVPDYRPGILPGEHGGTVRRRLTERKRMSTPPNMNDFNKRVIEEFRANEGKVGGMFANAPVMLLTTTGAKSGRKFTLPLVFLPDGERMVIFASKAGAPTNPDWYHNLVANPVVTVEVGAETYDANATVITGEERDQLYARQVAAMPQFGEYAAKTTRLIPVIALDRVS
jgi:deazaflavin-dependent oxidoreductase (nitroreductase family)